MATITRTNLDGPLLLGTDDDDTIALTGGDSAHERVAMMSASGFDASSAALAAGISCETGSRPAVRAITGETTDRAGARITAA